MDPFLQGDNEGGGGYNHKLYKKQLMNVFLLEKREDSVIVGVTFNAELELRRQKKNHMEISSNVFLLMNQDLIYNLKPIIWTI